MADMSLDDFDDYDYYEEGDNYDYVEDGYDIAVRLIRLFISISDRYRTN